MNLNDLKKPFPAEDIEWRIQQSGKKDDKIWALVLAYVTNRAIMERLDEVCGPENWKNYFEKAPEGGILCGIAIKCGDEWVTKWDGAENTEFEAVKGGLSSSMKRAGHQWGIGRYLYRLPVGWAIIGDKGSHSDKLKDGTRFKWSPPTLPKWALPEGDDSKPPVNPVVDDESEPKLTLKEWKGHAKKQKDKGYDLREWYKGNKDEIAQDLTEKELSELLEYCAELVGKE